MTFVLSRNHRYRMSESSLNATWIVRFGELFLLPQSLTDFSIAILHVPIKEIGLQIPTTSYNISCILRSF